MYNIKLYDYVPEPQPVSSDYIVAAHYYAAWKKGAAGLHNAFFDLHDYPERTPLAGYYDEENPAYTDWEIKWALEHGVNCFIYCWYRKRENMGKPVTVDDLRCAHGLHEALFQAKYQNRMKFAIMYEAQNRWGGTDRNDLLSNLMPFWMREYFTRENYLVIDNKPVLFVYDDTNQIRDAFGSSDAQREAFDACREYAVKKGFSGMLFALQNRGKDPSAWIDALGRGYDFHFSYNWGFGIDEDRSAEAIIRGQHAYHALREAATPGKFCTTASCFWDPEPRFKTIPSIPYEHNEWYLSPDEFRRVLRDCKAFADRMPKDSVGRKLIMIDNWNEWDEGHFVAPSHAFGFRYLQAIREELTARDNLPDYRMPQDIGLSNFNKSWGSLDLSEVCRKKFHLK